jgi:hypothetical protein
MDSSHLQVLKEQDQFDHSNQFSGNQNQQHSKIQLKHQNSSPVPINKPTNCTDLYQEGDCVKKNLMDEYDADNDDNCDLRSEN